MDGWARRRDVMRERGAEVVHYARGVISGGSYNPCKYRRIDDQYIVLLQFYHTARTLLVKPTSSMQLISARAQQMSASYAVRQRYGTLASDIIMQSPPAVIHHTSGIHHEWMKSPSCQPVISCGPAATLSVRAQLYLPLQLCQQADEDHISLRI